MRTKNSLTSEAIKLALDNDYTYDRKTGNVYGKNGRLLKGKFLRLFIPGYGSVDKGIKICRHIFIAYMKYGERSFDKDVLFADGNRENLSPDNIVLGDKIPWNKPNHPKEMIHDIAENFHKNWGGGGVRALAKKWGVSAPTISRVYERHHNGKEY